MPKDAADLHVERWRDHWVLDERFDDDVEAMTVRLNEIVRWFDATTKTAAAKVGLQDFEYATLHALMIRETPGKASPTELAESAKVSNAGMTGRLDTMEKKGWLKRMPGRQDRRRGGRGGPPGRCPGLAGGHALARSGRGGCLGSADPARARHPQQAPQEDDPAHRGGP